MHEQMAQVVSTNTTVLDPGGEFKLARNSSQHLIHYPPRANKLFVKISRGNCFGQSLSNRNCSGYEKGLSPAPNSATAGPELAEAARCSSMKQTSQPVDAGESYCACLRKEREFERLGSTKQLE